MDYKPTEVVVHCMRLGVGLLCGRRPDSVFPVDVRLAVGAPPEHQYVTERVAVARPGEVTCEGCRAELARRALESSGTENRKPEAHIEWITGG